MKNTTNQKTSWWERVLERWRAAPHVRVEPYLYVEAPTLRTAAADDSSDVRIPAAFTRAPEAGIVVPEPRAHAIRISRALGRLFEQTQEDAAAAEKAGDDPSFRTLSALFPVIDEEQGYDEVVLVSEKVALFIVPTKISLLPIQSADGQGDITKSLTAESAYAMALVASKNAAMLEKGIRLSGSEHQQAIMRAAIERVNAELPEGQKLVIRPPQAKLQPVQAVAANGAEEEKPVVPVAQAAQQPVTQPVEKPVPAAEPPQAAVPAAAKAVAAISKPDVVPAPAAAADKQPKTSAIVNKTRRALFFGRDHQAGNPAAAQVPPSSSDTVNKGLSNARTAQEDAARHDVAGKSNGISRRTVAAGGIAALLAAALAPSFHPGKTPAGELTADADIKKSDWSGPASEPLAQKEARVAAAQETPASAPVETAGPPDTSVPSPQRSFRRTAAPERTVVAEKQGAPQAPQPAPADEKPQTGHVRLVNRNTAERMMMDFAHVNPRVCTAGDFKRCHGEFNYIARDWRRNETKDMDPALMQVIANVVTKLRDRGYAADEVTLLSGYRAPSTNSNTPRARKRSQHLHGKALDFRIEGVPQRILNDVCCEVVGQKGGVGRYNRYAHVDTRGYGVRWHG